MDLYIQAKSKKEINNRLNSGESVYGTNYSMFGGGGTHKLDSDLPTGTVIKVYEKTVNGSPYAKSYGIWNAVRRVVTVIVLMLMTTGAFSQTIERDADGNFRAVSKSRTPPKETTYTFTDSKGRKYPVLMTEAGRFFVIKTSAKTGKEYRYYLDKKPTAKK